MTQDKTKKIQLKKAEKRHIEMAENQLINRRLVKTAPDGVCISFQHINKIYPNHKQAVFDFNLDIKEKEFIVFVGPSGCGKSTTLRMLAGLEDITYGDLYIDGKFANDLMPKERDVAMVFQNYALYPNMTVYDNMAFSLAARRFDKGEIDRRVRHAAEILEIADYLDVKPANLSGGQRQRVALGRAIVRNPKVFLMDEPLSNLDAKLRVQMRSEIVKLHNSVGATTIYVTHDQTEAMTMASRIVVMKDGVVQQIGTPEEIYNKPSNVFVSKFIGSPAMNVVDCVVEGGMILLPNGLAIPLNKMQKQAILDFYDSAIVEYTNKISQIEKEIADRKYELTHPDYVKAVLDFERQRSKLSAKITRLTDKLHRAKQSERQETIVRLQEEIQHCREAFVKLTENFESVATVGDFAEIVPKNYQTLLETDDYLAIYNADLENLRQGLEYFRNVVAGPKYMLKFGIRPEEMYRDGGACSSVSDEFVASVSVSELLGHECYVHFYMGKDDFIAKINVDRNFAVGESVSLRMDLRYIRLFDPYSEKAIF